MGATKNLNSAELITALLNELDSEMNHLSNVIEVIRTGLKHAPYDDKEDEISCMYVLDHYIQYLQCAYVLNILDLIDSK